jgi:hypothetical protein
MVHLENIGLELLRPGELVSDWSGHLTQVRLQLEGTCIMHFLNPSFLCTAKKQYRKLETNIPEKELRGTSPNFHIHVSVSDLYFPTIGLPILRRKIVCGPILGIYKLLTDTCM